MSQIKRLTQDEKDRIAPFVSDTEGDVFIVTGPPGVVGAMFARYSRAPGGFRETFVKEFLDEQGNPKVEKASELMERVLVGYGDDSVGELEGVHVSLENMSNVVTKIVEDERLEAWIEQSTRYVVYDQRDENGDYRYHVPEEVKSVGLEMAYRHDMDNIFGAYCDCVTRLVPNLEGLKPLEEAVYPLGDNKEPLHIADCAGDSKVKEFKRTWKFDIKSKACDIARVLLPAATKTNVGGFIRGRSAQNLLTDLYSQPLLEGQRVGRELHAALDTHMPVYVKRAGVQEYWVAIDQQMWALADEMLAGVPPDDVDNVVLMENPAIEEEYMDFLVAQMLYAYSQHSLGKLRELVAEMSHRDKMRVFNSYQGDRRNRWDRPGRALEFGYPLTWDFVADFGIYRDLHRHRMLTQMRQLLTTDLGYDLSPIFKEIGMEAEVLKCEQLARDLYQLLREECGRHVAQYAALFMHNIRWSMGMNPREAMHLCEIRSGKQGHPSYRLVAQKMHLQIGERYPYLADAMKFVDHETHFWSRAESEAHQRMKERALGVIVSDDVDDT